MTDYGEFIRSSICIGNSFCTSEAYPCPIKDSSGRHLLNYKIYGNSSQEGVPSPSNPVDVISVGTLVTDSSSENFGKYEIPVVTYGTNMATPLTSKMDSGVYSGTVTNNPDGSIFVTAGSNTHSTPINLRANSNTVFGFPATVTVSCAEATQKVQLHVVVTNSGNTKATHIINDGSKPVTFSILADDMVRLFLNMPKGSSLDNDTTFHPQMEYGTVATPYKKYIAPVTTNIYLDEPLRKIGEYSDYIDFKRKMVIRKIGEYIISSGVTWNSWQETVNGTRVMITPASKLFGNNIKTLGFFNIGKTRQGGSDWASSNNTLNAYHLTPSCYWYPVYTDMGLKGDEDIATANKLLQNWIKSAGKVYFTHVLATPTETKISLPVIPTQKGNVFILTKTPVPASNIYARYSVNQ